MLSFVRENDRAQRSEIHRKSAQTVQAAHQYTRACALRACMCVSRKRDTRNCQAAAWPSAPLPRKLTHTSDGVYVHMRTRALVRA